MDQEDLLSWLAERPERFDLLIGLDIIEHFARDEALRFLELAYAALKPGGRLVLQTLNADSPFGPSVFYGDITHEWAYNVNQLARLLRRAGFVAIEARGQGPVPWGYSLASTARFLVWRLIRAGLQLWNLAETGATLPVLTRVFLIKLGLTPLARREPHIWRVICQNTPYMAVRMTQLGPNCVTPTRVRRVPGEISNDRVKRDGR